MARAATGEDEGSERRGELAGLALLLGAVMVFLALATFDGRDLSSRAQPPNDPPRNWLGRIGAIAAGQLFFAFGDAAFVIPALGALFGLARLLPPLAHLRRRRSLVAALILTVAVIGLLDLFKRQLPSLAATGNSVGPGGVLGHQLNRGIIYLLNRIGAGIFYSVIYLGSLLALCNLTILDALRRIAPGRAGGADPLADQKRNLEKQAREIARRTRALGDQTAGVPPSAPAPAPNRTSALPTPAPAAAPPAGAPGNPFQPHGIGADLQPVPEPKFEDHSVPKVAPPATIRVSGLPPDTAPSAEPEPAAAADSIPAPPRPAGRPTPPSSDPAVGDEETPGNDEPIFPATNDEAGEVPADSATAPAPPPGVRTPRPAVRGISQPRKAKPITVATAPLIGNYQLPSLDLLNPPDLAVKPTETKEDLMGHSRLMVQTLAQFGIEVAPGDITRGPTITRYELHPAPGVKLERIAALTNNIAAALKAERIHILAPVPGKSSVGVEVPNAVKTKVIMRDLLESSEWRTTKARIPLALGKDVYGLPIIADLAEMPHLLIAGSTGSGKSVCINTIIASLLYRFSPDQLRFVMIDPKVVELQQYNALPHLVVPVVTDPKKVVLALRWVVNEMEKRYQIFARVGVRNVKSFNERPKDRPNPPPTAALELPLTVRKEKVEPGADGFAVQVDEEIVVPRDDDIVIPERLSYIVVIIDELADLMLVAPADVEMAIARITQMARAAGIHCIVATQRPSVDVITGVIKANIPARLAFQVASKVDSRTILDQMGADKLLGKGDMLYLPPGSGRLNRAQGALITDQEIDRVVQHIARQGKPSYEVDIHQALQKATGSLGQMSLDPDAPEVDGGDEELLEKCVEVIRTERKASVSLLQRRLKLGYGRASRLMDSLEDRGIVGPSKGAEPRDILLDLDGEGYDGGGQSMV